MMGRLASAALLAWLAACAPATEETAQEGIGTPELPAPAADDPSTATPSPANALPAGELPGEYRVAGVDGEDIDAPTGLAVSITEDTIELMRCAGFAWTYTYDDGVLELARTLRSPDEIICRPSPEAVHAAGALAAASRVTRTPSNGLEFSGGGRSVLLFSQ